MSRMLDKFREAKQPEIEALKKLEGKGKMPDFFTGEKPMFSEALRASGPGAIIAEFKRASPSKGEINLGMKPKKIAKMYRDNGAAAISVLTEEVYFKGSLDYLKVMSKSGLPLLRKDFILDPLQIQATAATRASALLLIARMFPDKAELARMVALSGAAGVEAVVEIFDEADLEMSRAAGASIIQVNNRDLDTLDISLDVSRRLGREMDQNELWIAASGVARRDEVEEMAGLGFTAVLIGTSLMASGDPGAELAMLAGR